MMEFREMESGVGDAVLEKDLLNLEETELRLGLPGTDESGLKKSRNSKRPFSESSDVSGSSKGSCVAPHHEEDHESAPAPKAQIVGWPPIQSYRKSTLQPKKAEAEVSGIFVKVSVDGAPYLRKIDLKVYGGYPELLKGLENMLKLTIGDYSEREGYKGSEYAPTYEDKEGDWMLVGDVPWEMFMLSCKRLRIMKESEARGLGYGV